MPKIFICWFIFSKDHSGNPEVNIKEFRNNEPFPQDIHIVKRPVVHT